MLKLYPQSVYKFQIKKVKTKSFPKSCFSFLINTEKKATAEENTTNGEI